MEDALHHVEDDMLLAVSDLIAMGCDKKELFFLTQDVHHNEAECIIMLCSVLFGHMSKYADMQHISFLYN